MAKTAKTAICVFVLAVSCMASAQPPSTRPIFRLYADELWLNLHHFLYVLGQAQGRDPGTLREAVRKAPADLEHGLAELTPAERDTWLAAVSAYASGLSKKSPTDDEPLAKMIGELARARDADTLASAALDVDTRAILERAAPIYRRAWWPAHRAANEAYAAALTKLVGRYGVAIRDLLTTKYDAPWPATGYAVHLAAYSTWAGAYSTYGNLLVVATNEGSGTHGLNGLEAVFHESMHQWDDLVAAALAAQARKLGVEVPDGLSHSLIFYTAGEAVRRMDPKYVPFGETTGRWKQVPSVRAALDGTWKPYLDGRNRGTRDEAFAAVLAKIALPVASPAQRAAASHLFTFETDELWLNLHHFLWVLGRTEAGIRDNTRQSAVTAASEAERASPSLSAEDRAAWAEAVHVYAAGLSRYAALQEPMPTTTRALASAGDQPTLVGVALDGALVAALEHAAPIYRKIWWPAHREANRAWRSATQALVDRHGAEVVDYVTRAYGAAWPASGYAVHVSAYANAGSAYSSGITGMIVTPSQSEFTAGLYALEAIVHEAMHQWDGQTFSAMRAAAPDARIPRDLTHALIFYTSGEAVRHVAPAHVPMADAFDIWPLKLSGATLPADRLKPLLVETWQPWLDGQGARDEALAALVTRASAVSPQ